MELNSSQWKQIRSLKGKLSVPVRPIMLAATLSLFVGVALVDCSKPKIQQNVSAAFPFQSRYVSVLGSKIHYVEVGKGRPILLLHGNPTSSYLWRNVIPHLKPHGRVIAMDLIGMGKSDKPDIPYRFKDHYRYVEGFIKKKGLKNITLVLHDWGSGLGFHYFAQNEKNVRGMAFMEAILRPASWSDFGIIDGYIFKKFRDPESGPEWILKDNFFLKKILPMMTIRKLGPAETKAYNAPFPDEKSRKPILIWPGEIPIDGKPADMHALISAYQTKLKKTKKPMLLLYAEPGAIIKGKEGAAMVRREMPNTKTVFISAGKHYIQEDQPDNIGRALAEWLKTLP